MSTVKAPSAYIVPVDPTSTAATSVVQGVHPAQLWSTTPSGQAPKPAKAGTTHLFFNTPAEKLTALTSLGPTFSKPQTSPDARNEAVRTAIGSAVQTIKGLGQGVYGQTVGIDLLAAGTAHAHAASEAAHLAVYGFDLKTDEPNAPTEKLTFVPVSGKITEQVRNAWESGKVYAEAQNLARTLMELPANMLTPTLFTERIKTEAEQIENVDVVIRERGQCAITPGDIGAADTHIDSPLVPMLQSGPKKKACVHSSA